MLSGSNTCVALPVESERRWAALVCNVVCQEGSEVTRWDLKS